MTLLALQRSMREYLIRGADEITAQIHGDPSPRLAVYHHAYRAQLVDCLRDTFERVWAWLGDAGFEAAVVDMSWYGSTPVPLALGRELQVSFGHLAKVVREARQLALRVLPQVRPEEVSPVVQDDLHNPSI